MESSYNGVNRTEILEVPVKLSHLCGAVAVFCIALFAVVPNLSAQEATPRRHVGYPQDWTERQIVFSRDGLARHPGLMEREPRVRNQARQRWQPQSWAAFRDASPLRAPRQEGIDRDWNVILEGHVRQNMFPAKYVFDPGAPPDCTNDYVVFGLNVAGTPGTPGGAANLVAFNNLYVNSAGTGYCAGLTAPTVLFAYNITTVSGGRILTSPVLSLDGTQIIFVESVSGNPGSSIFHALTWTAGQGGIDTAATPASMTSVLFASGAGNTSDSLSSPWLDYNSSTVYVGANNGLLYQITNALSSPTLSGGSWPITVSSGYSLTSPVLDTGLGLLMVGSANGSVYQIDTTLGAIVGTLAVGVGTGSGFWDPPIVDVTEGTTFVVNANTGGPSGTAVLVQADTTAALALLATAQIGEGADNGSGVHPKLYQPAFSNSYYNSPATGLITVCGTGPADTTPYQYEFGFFARTMNTTSPLLAQQLSTSPTDSCTGWTEFFNPNAGTVDTITQTSVTSDVLVVIANNSNLTVGEQVHIQGTAESFLNGQDVTILGLLGPGPTHIGFTAFFAAADYINPTDTGTVAGGNDYFFFGLTGDCTSAYLGGGSSTTGCVVALSTDSTIPTAWVAVSGGPSGIVVDNYSTEPQASSIYFTAATADTAYKFTQDGLN